MVLDDSTVSLFTDPVEGFPASLFDHPELSAMLPSRSSKKFSMTVLVKNKPSLTIPQAIAKKAGFKPGDLIEFKVTRGTVTVRTTTLPTADDEYAPRP
jgi:hypothetical protein